MPNFNPFSSDNEDTSFELGSPVNQAAKNVTKAASNQANDDSKAFATAMRDQLYGSSTPQEPGTDEANTAHTDNSNAATRAMAHAGGGGSNKTSNTNPNQTPEEQAKMEKIRHELFGNYNIKFRSAQNSAVNITTDVEQEMEKARKEREQKETQRKQEEEEEEKRKKEEERKKREELAMPAGKKTGMMFGKKQQEPIALRLSKVKTEINRGSTG